MPRQVDHDARRRTIAEAVCVLVDERGFEGIRLRDVADRAGVSMGAVQRCFTDKNEMLLFAVRYVGEQVMTRMSAVSGPDDQALAHAAEQVALLEPGDRTQARVWLAFIAQAAVAPALAAEIDSSYAALEDMFTTLIAAESPTTARRQARALLALIDGLTLHTLIGRMDAATAGKVLHEHLRLTRRQAR